MSDLRHHDTGDLRLPHHPPPAARGIHRFTRPGWWRALWTTPLVGFAGLGLVCLIRWAAHWDPIWYSVPLVTVATVTFPMGLLIGIGAFDYWACYFSGKPTRPEDHSGHGARKLAGLLPPNTDHKVIGIQYLVTTFFFFFIGGFLAMLIRAELAQPGTQYFDPQTYNEPLLGARGADDLRCSSIPVVRRARELRHPADDRRRPTWPSRA